MTEGTCTVSVSRKIPARATTLFGLVTRTATHPAIDGSGMVTSPAADTVIGGVGDVFTMRMHNGEMGDYEMANHVVEYEPGRLLTWEPVLAAASRPEDIAELGDRARHRWGFVFEPLGRDETLVTETYDCTRSPEWLRRAVRGGDRWVDAMTETLEKLERLARGA